MRRIYRQRISQLSPSRKQESSVLATHALKRQSETFSGYIVSFWPMLTKHELDLRDVNNYWARQNRLVLPKINPTSREMSLHLVHNVDELIPTPRFKELLEPNPCLHPIVSCKDIGLVVVPGLAFDSQLYRLGKGGGYYDYLLSQNPNMKTIGVGFKEQFSEQNIPRECHDQPVDELALF